MQENLIFGKNPFLKEEEKAKLVEAQIRFLGAAKRRQIPVIVLEYKDKGKTIPQLRKVLSDMKNYTLEKPRPNGFYETELSSLLEKEKISRLILTGIYSHACVYETAEAAKNGFKVFTCRELMDDPYDNYLRWYQQNTDCSKTIGELILKIDNQ